SSDLGDRRGGVVSRRAPRPARQGDRMQSRPERPARPATSSRLRRARLALVLPLTLLLSACASYAPQDTLRPKGPFARSIDNLWDGVLAIAVVVLLIMQLGTLFIIIRFRRRHGDDELPSQT